MSWQTIDGPSDIDLKIRGKIIISFTCPRCDKEQEKKVEIGIDLDDIKCNNPLCGDYFTMTLDNYMFSYGRYKGINQVPLGENP